MGFRPTPPIDSGDLRSVTERMDWNLLKTFCVVAVEKSISKGAARLNLSQPAVSQAIKRLEEQLGTTLIERDSHKFEITQIGILIIKIATAARRNIQEIDAILEGKRDHVQGVIRILTVSGVNSPAYDKVLREMHSDFPGVTFNIEVSTTQEIISAVRRNVVPFGVAINQPGEVDIKQCMLTRETTFFYCSNYHPLFSQESVTLEHIKATKLVSFSGESLGGTLSKLSEHYGSHYIHQQISASSANTAEMLRLVLAGIGVGALPEHIGREYEERGLLRKLIPEKSVCEVFIVMMWSADQVHTEAETIFLKRMQTTLDLD